MYCGHFVIIILLLIYGAKKVVPRANNFYNRIDRRRPLKHTDKLLTRKKKKKILESYCFFTSKSTEKTFVKRVINCLC